MEKRSIDAMANDANSLYEQLHDDKGLKWTELSASEFHNRELINWRRARSIIEHENLLVNYRITWLLLSQGALLGAFATLYVKMTETNGVIDIGITLIILASLGLASAFNVFNHLKNADTQLQRVTLWWYQEAFTAFNNGKNDEAKAIFDKMNEKHPPLHFRRDLESILGRDKGIFRWNVVETQALPLYFIFLWVSLIIAVLVRQVFPESIEKISYFMTHTVVPLGWTLVLVCVLVLLVMLFQRRK